jgi:hypothetical protein
MVNGCELPGGEGDRPLATAEAVSEAIPGFGLSAEDSATLMSLLVAYGPYKNGETALFCHIVGIIGSARKPAIDLSQEFVTRVTSDSADDSPHVIGGCPLCSVPSAGGSDARPGK